MATPSPEFLASQVKCGFPIGSWKLPEHPSMSDVYTYLGKLGCLMDEAPIADIWPLWAVAFISLMLMSLAVSKLFGVR